jgi:putative membrane protein
MKSITMITVLCLSAFAFADKETTTTTTTSQTGTTPATVLSDGQIAKILVTINKGEIDQAKKAESKSKNKDVQDFAKMMISQHKDNEKMTKEIAKKDSIKMEDSTMVKDLENECKVSEQQLKEAAAFDKIYVSLQVTMHQKALEIINQDLLPNAKNSDLRTHLEKTKEAVMTHLDHAKALQQKLM